MIDKLIANPNFSYGSSVWYLAMISFAVQRHSEFVYHKELYKDYNYDGIYTLEAVQRWLDCDILGAIGYYKYRNSQVINYYALRGENTDYILDAAKRINKKYETRELDNSLILDIAEELNILHLPNLRSCLVVLGKGIRDLELLITILILSSLLFGVLIPVILLILASKENWFHYAVSIISSINIGLILFFILKLPFFINKELKWS
ncbi:MAG: hypothetical protein M0Q26_10970 [Chitinophagaceae bacterium]|nr:hypothetical protein [Chitinophagaceae bacterium]